MAHSYRAHYFHLIWSTKDRYNIITEDVRNKLYPYINGIFCKHDVRLIEVGGMPDHIHLLVEMKLLDKFSTVLRQVKSSSSVWIHKNYPNLKYFAWQDGYASFSVSISSIDKVRNYIKSQEKHHTKLTFADEYKKFLKHHNIEFDERFVLG